jgi:thiol-disulfide isomerase/thioredoxin
LPVARRRHTRVSHRRPGRDGRDGRDHTTGVNGTPVAATSAVPQTLAFTAHTVGGKRFDAASLAGKPVVLWFWAAWCPRRRAAAMT